MNEIENFKAYALDQLREYLVINDIEIESKDDFVKIYLDMLKGGYFYKADINDKLNEVKSAFNDLAKAYEKDRDILERDLIFFGSRRVLEKLHQNNTKR